MYDTVSGCINWNVSVLHRTETFETTNV